MAVKATSQISLVDLSDGKSLSAYITSNLPKTQIKDPNPGGGIAPDWAGTALVLTPVVFANQIPLALEVVTITWKRKEGSGAETALTADENVDATGNILTVSANKLDGLTAGQLTYLAYVAYTDPENGFIVNVVADISYTMIRTALNSQLAWISGGQTFKYDAAGAVTPGQITLNANLSNVTVQKWQYRNSSGVWTDYPPTADNANITSSTLNVKPEHDVHGVFVNDIATLRILTSVAGVEDVTTIARLRDGATGGTGAPGLNALTALMSNGAHTLPKTTGGAITYTNSGTTIRLFEGTTELAYDGVGTSNGTWKVTPTATGITTGSLTDSGLFLTVGQHSAMTGDTARIDFLITGKRANGTAISITVTQTFSVSLQGATGSNGTNSVVFRLYAPNGAAFVNQQGSLLIQTAAYNGTTVISSGATYVWKKYTAGSWQTIAGQTGSSLTVAGSDVAGVQAYQCVMTYGGQTYTDTIVMTDKTDNYQAAIFSTGGDVFKNTVGESVLGCQVQQNGVYVDDLKTPYISDAAPPSPVSGTFWYKVDKVAKMVTLQKYNGSTWANASGGDLHTMTYKWYRRDKDGVALDPVTPFKTGKLIFVNGADVDVKTTFTCEVE